MTRIYKICSPFVPGVGHYEISPSKSSDQVATNERVDNIRIVPMTWDNPMAAHGPALAGPPAVLRAAVERYKLWENGRRLRVKFLDGLTEVQDKVAAIAKEWEGVANLTFSFVNSGAAEIRISFAEKGFSWSAVGTDALTIPPSRPTMNYGWLEPTTSLREYQRVVRHEFGHALGMIHEHQNPAALGKIPWDKPKVYAYYAQQGWSQADVDFNIFNVYSRNNTNFTEFDPASIMEYAIPDSLTIGSYSIGWNTELSPVDIDFMKRQYPKQSTGMVQLIVGGARLQAALSAGGEVDTYCFNISTGGIYRISTEGTTDTVMTLHGPNDPGAILTWDDDRGKGKNALISRRLFPGSYWLSVRHKNPFATGPYTIGVKRVL